MVSSCATIYGKEYIKPRIVCEAGRNKGQGNEKSDCWFSFEIGTVFD